MDEIKKLERQIRYHKRKAREGWALARKYEKELDLTAKVLEVIEDSIVEAVIPVPQLYAPKVSEHDETVVLLMSDIHVGKKTVTYNPNVFANRMDNLEHRMMSIVTQHRAVRLIRKLVIVLNGDVIDSESVYPGQAVDHIAIPIIDQLYSVGIPRLTEFLLFCLANFEEVEVYCTRGNHGRQNAAKWTSSKSTNWDYVAYKSLEAMTINQPRLKWNINVKDWKSMFRIEGWGFLAAHGDMIRRYYSLPYYGMTRQAMRWQNAYRDKMRLTYFLFGHFHSAGIFRFNNCVVIMNGSFVTDDPYAEENLGVASVPEQTLFFVHKKYGVSSRYTINLK